MYSSFKFSWCHRNGASWVLAGTRLAAVTLKFLCDTSADNAAVDTDFLWEDVGVKLPRQYRPGLSGSRSDTHTHTSVTDSRCVIKAQQLYYCTWSGEGAASRWAGP